jgi:hypothetical protein
MRRMAGHICTSLCSSERKRRGHIEARTIGELGGGNMCPACVASIVVMAAGAGATGSILAVCIGKFRRFFRASAR